ncbi:MAG: regulatory iron-sulfur-containing complex subunit RicT [Candidatus Neomarinimicrobiota bacterium]
MNDNPDHKVIKIKFKGCNRALCQNPLELPIQPNDKIIVSADRGEEIGCALPPVSANNLPQDMSEIPAILRKATPEDLSHNNENRLREKVALEFCITKVAELGLPMKLVDVDLRLDRRKIVFYFTADDRIDFRELVKLLAAEFKTRIEMRQISGREEMKRTDGIGPCGLQLCCACFIDDFDPISTQLVKEQNLPMNPAKISGVCGKLKCCYRYEHDLYEEVLKNFPSYGSRLKVADKEGVLEKIDIFAATITVRYDDNQVEDFPLTDFNQKITVIQ